jgi:hypothetical protein
MAKENRSAVLAPPKRERGLRKTGFTIAGYPFAQFGVPTIIHARRVRLENMVWKETEQDCGGIMKAARIWVNDQPGGYEVVLGLECQDCKYTDSIRIPYSGHKQLFNSASNRTWSLKEGRGQ